MNYVPLLCWPRIDPARLRRSSGAGRQRRARRAREISRVIELPGRAAVEQAVLYAKVAGYLKLIRVDKGDTVKQGELLAEIEVPELLADETPLKAEVAWPEYDRRVSAQKKAPDLVMPQSVDEARGQPTREGQPRAQRDAAGLHPTSLRSPAW